MYFKDGSASAKTHQLKGCMVAKGFGVQSFLREVIYEKITQSAVSGACGCNDF